MEVSALEVMAGSEFKAPAWGIAVPVKVGAEVLRDRHGSARLGGAVSVAEGGSLDGVRPVQRRLGLALGDGGLTVGSTRRSGASWFPSWLC